MEFNCPFCNHPMDIINMNESIVELECNICGQNIKYDRQFFDSVDRILNKAIKEGAKLKVIPFPEKVEIHILRPE